MEWKEWREWKQNTNFSVDKKIKKYEFRKVGFLLPLLPLA
jgi:hypothetical protein